MNSGHFKTAGVFLRFYVENYINYFQAALGPAALDLVNSGQTSGASKEHEEYYAKAILAVSVLSVMLSAPLGALLIAITGPKLLSKDDCKYIFSGSQMFFPVDICYLLILCLSFS